MLTKSLRFGHQNDNRLSLVSQGRQLIGGKRVGRKIELEELKGVKPKKKMYIGTESRNGKTVQKR